MKAHWMKISAAGLLALAIACGNSENPALTKKFNYAAPAAPTAAEPAAANEMNGGAQDATTFSTADSSKGLRMMALAETLAAEALSGSGVPFSNAQQQQQVSHALRTATTVDPACTTVTATSVTFKNCSATENGFTATLNGSLTVTGSTITWGIELSASGSQNGVSINIGAHQNGTFTIGADKLTGHSLSDFGGSVSAQGQTVSFGLATAAVVDLSFQTTPTFCVSSGSVEVKRVWTQKPQGASGPEFADAAVKITWTGCNSVQVSHST